jgi:phosphoribosylformylglycinamidine cyclo-ligase
MAHITGGGITENLPRTLPAGAGFSLDRDSWEIPSLFRWLQKAGDIPEVEMFRAFNMGVGLILVCASEDADRVVSALRTDGEPAWLAGRVIEDVR